MVVKISFFWRLDDLQCVKLPIFLYRRRHSNISTRDCVFLVAVKLMSDLMLQKDLEKKIANATTCNENLGFGNLQRGYSSQRHIK